MRKISGYYFITDSRLSRAGIFHDVKNALQAKVKIVQYREKHKSTKEMYAEARKLRVICKDIIFLVNDRADIALAVGADGIHIGKEDLPYQVARKLLGKKRIIGVTVHNFKEAQEAQRKGADYIGVSPIFGTRTKSDAGRPVGTRLIMSIKKHVRIPVIAVGGINLENAREVIRFGADGLCAISAVVVKPKVREEIEKFQALFRQYNMQLGRYDK